MAQIDFLYQYYCECLGLDPANETTALENQCVLIASKIGNEITFNDETRASIQSEADEIGITYNMCLKVMLVEDGMDELLMINVTVSNGDTFDTALLNLYSYQITEDRTYTFEAELQDGSGRKGEHTVVVGQEGSSVTNPYEENGWEMAWTYSTEDGWSDMIAKGTTLDENIDIVAKFYKTGNTIKPTKHPLIGDENTLPEGPEYNVVIEGNGPMGSQLDDDTLYGYRKNTLSGFLAGAVDNLNVIYPSYVTEVYVCDGVESIGGDAFRDFTSLTQIHIPNTVKTIEKEAFSCCVSLTNITLPEGLTVIGESAFSSCKSLENITIPSTVVSIGRNAFNSCESLTSIEIPEGVTTISYGTFSSCANLERITIPSSVTSIGEGVFKNCACLDAITIPSNVKTIGKDAFSWCKKLTNIIIPESVEELGQAAFYGCSGLESVTISSKITTIHGHTFGNCNKLTSITIPNGVTTIENSAFDGCLSLKEIYLPSTLTSVSTFGVLAEDVIIYVPNTTVENLVKFYNVDYTISMY